ncbi:MAG: nuclear transport factor 2 family protein [Deltaproteobacteria bacterium]|nr:nuclear transport factor 2 family protein [Deltaproteobacteria bacterium]
MRNDKNHNIISSRHRGLLKCLYEHDWDAVFDYISDDCVWDASERRLEGRQEIVDYWTNYHAAFKETLGKPEKVVSVITWSICR